MRFSIVFYCTAFLICLSVEFSQAQSSNATCGGIIESKLDSVSGKVRTTAKEAIIVSDDGMMSGFLIKLWAVDSITVMSTEPFGKALCLDRRDRVEVLFQDGTKMSTYHYGRGDCDKKLIVAFGHQFRNKSLLSALQSKLIKTVRINSQNEYAQTSFFDKEAKEFRETVGCLVTAIQ